jgi:hypothetical protein
VAEANGFGPQIQEFKVGQSADTVEFRLTKGKTLIGRVADQDQNPVADATVAVAQWRGRDALQWKTKTDAQGRFRWDDAPDDEVMLLVKKPGFRKREDAKAQPGPTEQTFTLRPALKIRGTVIDAQTGNLVEEFRVTPGTVQGGIFFSTYWRSELAKTFTNGTFEIAFDDASPRGAVRIQADGYQPLDSPPFSLQDKQPVFQAKLKKGTRSMPQPAP